jgi:hypothetical protein
MCRASPLAHHLRFDILAALRRRRLDRFSLLTFSAPARDDHTHPRFATRPAVVNHNVCFERRLQLSRFPEGVLSCVRKHLLVFFWEFYPS